MRLWSCVARIGTGRTLFLAGGLFAALAALSWGEAIVGWLGDGTGRYPNANPPLEWGPGKNEVWRRPMPSWSNGSPAIVGGKIFVTSEPTDLICVNSADGNILWSKPNNREGVEPPRTHQTNGYSSPTPVSDGRHVYALFGNGVVACYALDGTIKWQKYIEDPWNFNSWGQGSSPILGGGKLLIHLTDFIALDPETGDVAWSVMQQEPHWWGSPAVTKVGGVDVAITPFGDVVRISDGAVLADKLPWLEYNTPVVQDGVVYFMQGPNERQDFGPPRGAFRLPANLEEPVQLKRLWDASLKIGRYYASPLIHNGLIYSVSQKGILTVTDAAGGANVVDERRLEDLQGTVYPSVSLAGDHIVMASENGTAIVMKPGKDGEIVARNNLGEKSRATPVFDGNRMYARGYQNLYCFGAP